MLKLSHIGENLFAEMVNRSSEVRSFLSERLSLSIACSDSLNAVAEVPLSRCAGLKFDGAHKIDVALLAMEPGACLAIELKLGTSGMGRKTFENRFLKPCTTSHREKRVAGSMISVLEGKLPAIYASSKVMANKNGSELALHEYWGLVVRKPVADAWSNGERPALSGRCSIIVFEEVVGAFGGKESFNVLVQELLEHDYFEQCDN